MDDFTKKDKYASINSAIKEVVSQNNNLHQKALAEKYGFKQEQTNEEVEQLDEGIKDKVKKLIHRKLVDEYVAAAYSMTLEKAGMEQFAPGGDYENPEEYKNSKAAYNRDKSEMNAAAAKLKKVGINPSSIKYPVYNFHLGY